MLFSRKRSDLTGFFSFNEAAPEAKTCQVFGMAERLHRGAIQSGESWLTDKFQIDTVVR